MRISKKEYVNQLNSDGNNYIIILPILTINLDYFFTEIPLLFPLVIA